MNELDVLQKALNGKAKTTCQIAFNCSVCANEDPITCTLRGNDKKWVSLEDATALLMKLVQERDDNKLLVIQAVTKLRAKEEQLERKVSIDCKQLEDFKQKAKAMQFHFPDWMKPYLKELLEGSPPLSPEEIKDIEASEKEFAEGKCKTFETAEDLIADLHKGRKKGSVGVEK